MKDWINYIKNKIMCNITDKKSKLRTGYKVLAYKEGKFYSTFTGQEISVGQVPKAPERATRLNTQWLSELDYFPFKDIFMYRSKFDGKTAAFTTLKHCKNEFWNMDSWGETENGYELVIVKIVFGNTAYKGYYNSSPIIASDIIKSIEIVKS